MKKISLASSVIFLASASFNLFAACAFNDIPSFEGSWTGGEAGIYAKGEVLFNLHNTESNHFAGTAFITTAECTKGECTELEYIVNTKHTISGTCFDNGDLRTVTFDDEDALMVSKKTFWGELMGFKFKAVMNY